MSRPSASPLTDEGAPLWSQLADRLRERLRDGRPAPGGRLPSEARLCAEYRVSRATLRQALQALEREGRLVPQVGRGWFRPPPGVAPAAPDTPPAVYEPPGQLLSFTDMARSRGLRPDSLVLSRTVRPADLDEAELLDVAPGTPLLSLRRLRRLDGLPVALDHSLVPAALLPAAMETDYAAGSLYASLRAVGVEPGLSDYELTAVAADQEQAGLLDVEPGAPLLSAAQLMYDVAGRKVEKGRITYRGDRYRFRAVLHA